MGTDHATIAPAEVLAVFAERAVPGEPLTAPEVADQLGCARRTAHKKLTRLADSGSLRSKKVGARGRVWWTPRDGAAEDRDRSDASPSATGLDRRAHERALRELHVANRRLMRAERHGAVAEIAVAAARRILGLSLSGLWLYRPDEDVLAPAAWTDPGEETYGEPPAFPLEGSLVGEAFRAGEFHRYDDVRSAEGLYDPDTRVRSELIFPLGEHGVLNASSPDVGAFDDVDVSLGRVLAATVQTALDRADRVDERRQRRRALERQRDELESLNRINTLIEETIGALVDAATREELERTVCRRLASSDVYRDAWILERESTAAGAGLRTRATGTDAPSPELVADEPLSPPTPVTDALQHRRVEVVPRLDGAATHAGPFREAVDRLGAESCLVVPLAHAETVFGALVVHAPDPDGFGDREVVAFDTLGRVVGFVINATNNRQLLLGNTAVEIEVAVDGTDPWFLAAADRLDATLELEGLVPTDEDTLIEYVTVRDVTVDTAAVTSTVGALPAVETVRVLGADDEGCLLECHLRAEAAALRPIADYGASVRTATAEPDRARVRTRFPTSASPRDALAVVREALPDADLVAKRVVDVSDRTVTTTREVLDERLTAKQLAALRAARHAGYYDTPRGTTATELASSLDIAPSTLHQHLQAAQRKVLETVFAARSGR